jgi:prepilin-type N-terminal cleavage/methylation domain-containing protein
LSYKGNLSHPDRLLPVRIDYKELMKRKSVTLLELLIVIVVIGILATIAVPSYDGIVRRARFSKALNAMAVITQAEKIAQIENGLAAGTFIAFGAGGAEAAVGTAVSGVDLSAVDVDDDWTYSATDAGVVTANGVSGPISGCSFTYNMADNSHTVLNCP